jgi:signal transduction histidine kinase
LTAPPNKLAFDFVSVGFQAGERARYQFRLVGADRDWSPVGDRRSVQYANLSAGNYSFEVRAVNGDGVFSPQPAVAQIRVLAPVWRRGWFIAVWLALLGGLVYWAHRQRVGRLLAMERMRTRIATDLHDDLGSSLSQIAVLSQLAHDSVRRGAAASERSLSRITELSGELVDALGDVVWAINPASDSLAELASRMRRFASDLFADKHVKVRMSLPPRETRVQLDPQVRRHIYLVFKEALHNVQRHAGATRVDVVLCRAGRGWMLRITDDGRGFDLAVASTGHGLASLASRAKRLGGTLTIRSSPTEGTDLLLLTDPQASVPTQLSSEIVDWPTDSRAW